VDIRFSASNESKALKELENLAIEPTSIFLHWSCSQLIKETTASGKVANNHIKLLCISAVHQ
jgi:hypothetical protein